MVQLLLLRILKPLWLLSLDVSVLCYLFLLLSWNLIWSSVCHHCSEFHSDMHGYGPLGTWKLLLNFWEVIFKNYFVDHFHPYFSVLCLGTPIIWMWDLLAQSERLFLNHTKTLGFLATGGEEFNLGPETRLDRSELLCDKILLKYKGDRESFWHRHQKGVERVPTC